jgi:putative ABC transport system ATP-binding protein
MSMRSQVLVEHHGVATGKEMTTWQTLRRGVELSPELRKGIWVTVMLAVLSTLGRVLVPFVVQRITDNGLLAPGGPDLAVVAV